MLALSIRQPYAELILRGIKTAELRSIRTSILGERFYIYAPLTKAPVDPKIWSRDLAMPDPAHPLPAWMIELAEQVRMIEPELLRGALLPRGVIVGSAVIERVLPPDEADGAAGLFRWLLADVRRIKTHLKPTRHPQPVWFEPFD